MATEKPDLFMAGPMLPMIEESLSDTFTIHHYAKVADKPAFLESIGPKIVAATLGGQAIVNADIMKKMPKLEIVSNFGVGYDTVDVKYAAENGIIVTNTPDVLNEEVADTTLGLMLSTVRELPQAERYLREGKWLQKAYPLTPASLRDRTVGIIGMGRIGKAIAKRIEAFGMPIVYHSRSKAGGVSFRHYPDLVTMARDVDILIAIIPGGAATKNMINAKVLEALGPTGIFINVARGSVVDEPALVEALRTKKIMSAGLDVFADEPRVPKELMEMENVVLLPHVASASVFTRRAMGQLVVDNLKAWAAGKPPLTPVVETPYPPKRK